MLLTPQTLVTRKVEKTAASSMVGAFGAVSKSQGFRAISIAQVASLAAVSSRA
jgi:hypothetical protein